MLVHCIVRHLALHKLLKAHYSLSLNFQTRATLAVKTLPVSLYVPVYVP